MPLVLLFLGLGSLFAWGVVRAKKEEESVRLAAPGTPGASPFPWEGAQAPVLPSVRAVLSEEKFVPNNYDEGLTEKELAAIVYAREHETDPKKLEDFADSLAPQFPISVLRLRERARQIRRAPWKELAKQTALSPKLSARAMTALISGYIAGNDDLVVGEKWSTFFVPAMAIPPKPVLEAEIAAATPVENIDFKPGDSEGWQRARQNIGERTFNAKLADWNRTYGSIQDVYETLIPVSRFSWGLGGPSPSGDPPTIQMKLGDALHEIYYDDESRKNKALVRKGFFASLASLISDAISAVGAVYTVGLKYVAAPILSYIPGLGTVSAAIVTASADIAMGEPVDEALVDGAAATIPFPGNEAFKLGVRAIQAAAKGERFDHVVINSIRDTVLGALPADMRKIGKSVEEIVETGMAMAQAKDLQDAGFQIWHKLARGNSPVEQAADFADKMDKSAKTNIPVEVLLKNQVQSDLSSLPPDARDQVLSLMSDLSADRGLLEKSPRDLATIKNVPEPVARAALGTVKVLPIPKWMSDKLGLGPMLYVDASLARELIREPTYLRYTTLKLKGPSASAVAKIAERDRWVSYYLRAIEVDKKPYLSPTAMRLPKGLAS